MDLSKKKKDRKILVGLSSSNSTCSVGRVKYIVKSRFKKFDDNRTLSHRVKKYILSDFSHLQANGQSGKINSSYVYSTAGKEDSNAVEKEN